MAEVIAVKTEAERPSGHKPANVGPDRNTRTPKMKVPRGAWDTHFHIIGPPERFPYMRDLPYTPAMAPLEDYLAMAAIIGFDRGVITEAAAHEGDHRALLDSIARSQGRLRGMILADPSLDDAAALDLRSNGVCGVRIELRRMAPDFDAKRFDALVSQAARAGWIVSLHVDPPNLPRFADLIRRMPTQTIVEAYGLIDARDGVDQPGLRALFDLAAEPHIWVKLSSAYRMVLKRGGTHEQMLAIGRAVHARIVERAIWGTDWPHPGFYAPTTPPNCGDLVDTLLEFAPDEAVRHRLLVDNPKRLFEG